MYSNHQYTIPSCVKAVRENPVLVYISLSLNYLVLTACQAPVVKNVDNNVDKSLKDGATQLTFLLPKVGTH